MYGTTPFHAPKVGDRFTMDVKPSLTFWDKILWRLFRIERKRPTKRQEFVVTNVAASDPD